MALRRWRPILAFAILVAACTPIGPASTASSGRTAAPLAARWRAVEVDLAGGWLSGAAELEGQIAAVGSTGSSPLVLTSEDGLDWVPVPDQPAFRTTGGASMTGLVATSDAFIAVGPGDAQSLVWRSRDGRTWEKVHETQRLTDAQLEAGERSEGYMGRIVEGPRGFVAVGLNGPGLVDDFGGAAWFSNDGAVWESAGPTVQLLRGPLWGVTTLGDAFVAVGGVRGATSLTSTDGRSWTLHEQRDILSPGQLRAATSTSDGRVLAVGSEEGGAFSATTSDGARWERGPCTADLLGGSMQAVARLGSGFVAGGWVGSHAAIWVSSNGLRWSRVLADLGDGEVNALLVREGAVLAVGTTVWIGPPDAVGDDRLAADEPCGAVPSQAPIEDPDEGPVMAACVATNGPYATDELPPDVPLCVDLGVECALPPDAPPITICEVELPPEPAVPPASPQ